MELNTFAFGSLRSAILRRKGTLATGLIDDIPTVATWSNPSCRMADSSIRRLAAIVG